MGLDIDLQDEFGHTLGSTGDPTNILHRLLPDLNDRAFPLVRFIDWNGNTVFNRLQMDEFLEEWERVTKKAHRQDELKLLAEIRDLAKQCRSAVHLYLKFIGD